MTSIGVSRDAGNNIKIAIFQYEWPIQSHTANLAAELANSGYKVELFLKGCPSSWVDLEKLKENPSINVIDLSYALKGNSGLIWFVNRFINLLYIIRNFVSYSPVYGWIVKKTFNMMKGSYKCIIGIEKKGLIWAHQVGKVKNVPYLYYSLELYLEDHPTFENSRDFAKLRQWERKAHSGAGATIIQDCDRANILFGYNRTATDTILFPISIYGNEMKLDSLYLQKRHGIRDDKFVLLYLGVMDEDRRTMELAMIMDKMQDDFVLVLHGFGAPEFMNRLKEEAAEKNVIISTELVSEKNLVDLVSSAHMGLAFYSDDCHNNRLTAFSSEKIALYLRSGLPIVAFNIGNYPSLMNSYKCGELINNMAELPMAIDKIIKSYKEYSASACKAYGDLYDYRKNYRRLEDYLSGNFH